MIPNIRSSKTCKNRSIVFKCQNTLEVMVEIERKLKEDFVSAGNVVSWSGYWLQRDCSLCETSLICTIFSIYECYNATNVIIKQKQMFFCFFVFLKPSTCKSKVLVLISMFSIKILVWKAKAERWIS